MPENVVPFPQHFSKMVRTCSQQVRHAPRIASLYSAGVRVRPQLLANLRPQTPMLCRCRRRKTPTLARPYAVSLCSFPSWSSLPVFPVIAFLQLASPTSQSDH